MGKLSGKLKYVRVVCDGAIRLLGVLLVVAAALKAWQFLADHTPPDDLVEAFFRVFTVFEICFEVLIGLWLVSGLWKKWAVRVAILCFAVFFCITLYHVGAGSKTCGCFGPIEVAPLITLLAIDLPAIIVLAAFGLLPEPTPAATKPKEDTSESQPKPNPAIR